MKNFKALALATTILGTTLAAGYAMNAQTGAALTETTPTVETQVAPAPVAPVVEVADANRELANGEIQVAVRKGDATFEGTATAAAFTDTNRHGNTTYIVNLSDGFEIDGKIYSRFTFTNDVATVSSIDGQNVLQGKFSIKNSNLKVNLTGTNLQIRFKSSSIQTTYMRMRAEQSAQYAETRRIEEDTRRSDWAEDQLINNNKNKNVKEATCARRRDLDRNTGSEWFVCQVRYFGNVDTHEMTMENDNGNWAARPTFNF